MRFSKKLLAALLPITATATVAPVLTSCGGDAYSIDFKSNVNCLDKNNKDVKYHSLDEVKKSATIHAPRHQGSIILESLLPKSWGESTTTNEKQDIYYDFIASHSLINSTEFLLIWGDTQVEFTAKDKDKITLTLSELTYKVNEDKTINIGTSSYSVKSYKFQNTKVGA